MPEDFGDLTPDRDQEPITVLPHDDPEIEAKKAALEKFREQIARKPKRSIPGLVR